MTMEPSPLEKRMKALERKWEEFSEHTMPDLVADAMRDHNCECDAPTDNLVSRDELDGFVEQGDFEDLKAIVDGKLDEEALEDYADRDELETLKKKVNGFRLANRRLTKRIEKLEASIKTSTIAVEK